MAGQIVNAMLIAAPRQRNTDAEKARIKAGETAAEIWPDKPAKARQKDVDARWTVKHSKAKPAADGAPRIDIAIPAFGYKSHISIDRRHGVIRRAKVRNIRDSVIRPSRSRTSTANGRFFSCAAAFVSGWVVTFDAARACSARQPGLVWARSRRSSLAARMAGFRVLALGARPAGAGRQR